MSDVLKPCPFCGEKALAGEHWPTWDTREGIVGCYGECGAQVTAKTIHEAIAAWNTRKDTPQ